MLTTHTCYWKVLKEGFALSLMVLFLTLLSIMLLFLMVLPLTVLSLMVKEVTAFTFDGVAEGRRKKC